MNHRKRTNGTTGEPQKPTKQTANIQSSMWLLLGGIAGYREPLTATIE